MWDLSGGWSLRPRVRTTLNKSGGPREEKDRTGSQAQSGLDGLFVKHVFYKRLEHVKERKQPES